MTSAFHQHWFKLPQGFKKLFPVIKLFRQFKSPFGSYELFSTEDALFVGN